MSSFLRAKSLHKKYSTGFALRGVSLSLNLGRHLFVIGETGSGKSTLLNSLFGTQSPDKGHVMWLGKQQNHRGQLIPGFEGMKLVKQDFVDQPFNTVLQILQAKLPPGVSRKEARNRVTEIAELFELREFLGKKVEALSGGQQQRLALASALVDLPQLLLLDEPFVHFDPQLKNRIFSWINQQIESQKMSAITVTHDYIETLKHATEVMVLNKGRVVQRASSSLLYLNPKNLYVAGLLGEFNVCRQKERLWFFRPEELMINPKGEHKATVVQKRFAGAYSEWTLSTEFGLILAYVNKDHVEGEQTRFSFPKHSEVILNKIVRCK